MGRSTVGLVRPAELTLDEIEGWRSVQRSARLTNPFHAPEFAIAVGNARPSARVALRRSTGRIDGVFAFETDRFGVGRRIGDRLSDQHAVVHPDDRPWEMPDLLASCGLAAARLENMPAARLPVTARRIVRYPSPSIDLTMGYPAYLESRQQVSTSMLRTAMRKQRKLEREVGPIRFEFDVHDRSALSRVMQWKSQQYAELDEWDRFADPEVVQLVDELFDSKAPGCAGTLSVLYAGDEIAAAHFGLRSEDVLCSWFPTYNPAHGRYSPGLLLHLHMIEVAAERGMVEFDLGRGEHGYKELLKTGELELARASVFGRTVPGLAHRLASAPVDHARVVAARSPRARTALLAARRAVHTVTGSGRP